MRGETQNEAVVESEGSCIDKHATGGRHLSQEALVMESVVHWNAPAPHRADDFIRDALNHYFDGPTWHFTTTDNRAKVHTVSEVIDRLLKDDSKLSFME